MASSFFKLASSCLKMASSWSKLFQDGIKLHSCWFMIPFCWLQMVFKIDPYKYRKNITFRIFLKSTFDQLWLPILSLRWGHSFHFWSLEIILEPNWLPDPPVYKREPKLSLLEFVNHFEAKLASRPSQRLAKMLSTPKIESFVDRFGSHFGWFW